MLTASEKQILKAYRKLQNQRPSGLKMILLNLVPMLVISSGTLLPAVLYFRGLSTRMIVPVWFLLALSWLSAMLPMLLMTYFQARKWPIVDEVTNWDRVHELLDDE
ncbi:MAG: hypothetical protein HQ518_02355 [Rhodopirellula sp.]|jgi:hypothetical protein|nr:hypothetical protein [Rhodopirellula sp.]